jgi:DNA-binding transcriptional ArsR family regulator
MVHNWDNVDFEIILHLLKESIHVRSLSSALNIPHATLARKLLDLRASNMIDYVQEGKNKKYFLKKNLFSKKAVIFAEHYKLLKFLSKEPNLIPLITDVLKVSKSNLVILFGSYAKGTKSSTSDIDIYVETQNVKEKKDLEKLN